MTRTYIKTQPTTVEIDHIEYELTAKLDGVFILHVWVWDTDEDIVRDSAYLPTQSSLKRLTAVIGTHQAEEAWFFENGHAVMQVTYTREL